MYENKHLLAKIGQYALIKNEGTVLILERSRSKVWSLPGGRLNEGEDWDKAFTREIKEETNLDVIKIKPFAVNILTDNYQIKYCVYFEIIVSNISELKLSQEHSNFKWIGSDNISEVNIEDKKVIEVISSSLNI